MNICLAEMNKALAHEYFKDFIVDPALFMDDQEFRPYIYQPAKVDERLARYSELGHVYLAVLLDNRPIGEIIFKNIDYISKRCTMGISMQCDDFKNRGYGTMAEMLALQYAFQEMNMETVFADSIIKNKRSQHVLRKVGFVETHQDDSFIYYRCDKLDSNCHNLI